MATRLQFRKFSTTSIATLVGANGELYVDTTKKTIVVQDGATTGGSTLATESWVSSALGTVSFSTSVLSNYVLSSALTSYTINANLTSTLANYTTNANLTSTLARYALSSTLTSYTTNANLTSTLASFTVSKLQYSSLTVQLDSSGSVTFPGPIRGLNSKLDFTSYGTSTAYLTTTNDDTTALFMGAVSAELYAQTNIVIRTNTQGTSKAWTFDETGSLTLPSGSILYSGYPGAGFVQGLATLAATQVYLSNTSGSSYIGISDTNRVILGYDDTGKYWYFDSSGAIILPAGGDIKNSTGNSVLGGSTFNSSVLTSYTTNANLTSTLTAYPTNANLTSTLSSYATKTFVTSALTSYTTNANLTSTLASYTTNANLTSTLTGYALSSSLTSYTTNANLTSTLIGYVTNANLTSTLATYAVSNRVLTTASVTSITIDASITDQYHITSLAVNATFNAPINSSSNGQKLIIRIEDNGTPRTLSWTTSTGGFRVIGVTLPTTTVALKNFYVGCIYNSSDVFWDVISVVQQA